MLLGRLAIHMKLITPQQASEALRAQGRSTDARPYGEILVELGFINQDQLAALLEQKDQQPPGPATVPTQPVTSAAITAATRPTPRPTPSPTPSPSPSPGPAFSPEPRMELARILEHAVKLGASDIHVHASAPIQLRVGGTLRPLKSQALSPAESKSLIESALTDAQRQRLAEKHELDFAITLPGIGRFRGNVYRQQRGYDGVFRAIPAAPPTLQQLGLPTTLARLTGYHQGLVLLTGPAGCGKSSTLAALVNLINEDRDDHIITVEDPIEYVHASKRCVVNQREVGRHARTFASDRSCAFGRNSIATTAPTSAIAMSVCVSHGSPCVPRKSSAAAPELTAVSHSTSS